MFFDNLTTIYASNTHSLSMTLAFFMLMFMPQVATRYLIDRLEVEQRNCTCLTWVNATTI